MGSLESLSVVSKEYCTASILALVYHLVVYVCQHFYHYVATSTS